jgi:hypothetical protein
MVVRVVPVVAVAWVVFPVVLGRQPELMLVAAMVVAVVWPATAVPAVTARLATPGLVRVRRALLAVAAVMLVAVVLAVKAALRVPVAGRLRQVTREMVAPVVWAGTPVRVPLVVRALTETPPPPQARPGRPAATVAVVVAVVLVVRAAKVAARAGRVRSQG